MTGNRATANRATANRASDEGVTVVVLTYERADEVLRTVARLAALPDAPRLIVVDNGSRDDTRARLEAAFPDVPRVELPRNVGAAARNAGVEAARTRYVALCDDDTWWAPGSLSTACALLDAHPDVAVLSARILVGDDAREDPACTAMSASPFPSAGVPGRRVLGFMAGASVVRREAFLAAGGFEPRFFIGGEERLLAIDLATAGWSLVYCDRLTVHHHPSPNRDRVRRERLLARNALWTAWLRRPLPALSRESTRVLRAARAGVGFATLAREAVAGLPWVLRHRRVVPPRVAAMLAQLDSIESDRE